MRTTRSAPATTAGSDRIVLSGTVRQARIRIGRIVSRGVRRPAFPPLRCIAPQHGIAPVIAGHDAGEKTAGAPFAAMSLRHVPHRPHHSLYHSLRRDPAQACRRAIPTHDARLMIASSAHCLLHGHAEALSTSPHSRHARNSAVHTARRIGLTGLGGFGTLSRN